MTDPHGLATDAGAETSTAAEPWVVIPAPVRRGCRAATIEAARARIRAAASQGSPVEIEAAARAYRTEANLALLADLWKRMAALPSAVGGRRRGRNTAARAMELEPGGRGT